MPKPALTPTFAAAPVVDAGAVLWLGLGVPVVLSIVVVPFALGLGKPEIAVSVCICVIVIGPGGVMGRLAMDDGRRDGVLVETGNGAMERDGVLAFVFCA